MSDAQRNVVFFSAQLSDNHCLVWPTGDCWFCLSQSDGTNLESNAGYMGSLYLNHRRQELFFAEACWGICSRIFCSKQPPFFCRVFLLLTTNVVNITCCCCCSKDKKGVMHAFGLSMEVKVRHWSSRPSVWCCTSHMGGLCGSNLC